MRARGQGGQTLVELMVGIAVAGIILSAVGGVLVIVSDQFNHWGTRVQTASQGFSLAGALQADGHRYVACAGARPGTPSTTLSLCQPAGCATAASYSSSPERNGTYAVLRTDAASPTAAIVDRAPGQPLFTLGVDATTGTVNVISVSGVRAAGAVVVYPRPPAGARCP